MNAREQHVWPVAKDLGRSIAVVDVPIQNEYPLQSVLGDRAGRGDRNVVEETEARCASAVRVVTGRPQATEAGSRRATEQQLDHPAGAPCGVQRGAKGMFTDEGVTVG